MSLFRLARGPVAALALVAVAGACRSGTVPAPATAAAASPDSIRTMHGFRRTGVYLNDADREMGGRFVHERTGFTLDLLEIQSVPQGFIWVNSFPTSDMGEPHTQEHLLLSKGDRGRAMASFETMALSASSAFTQQLRTVYNFNTLAGPQTFYQVFERQMDALLHPNYSDEEIRREVRNFGVTENPSDKSLRIEEKGTVYNEMVSSYDRPVFRLFRVVGHLVYGEQHPLAYSAGGTPEAIRAMQPEHIRTFHAANYHLGNMGMVASVPQRMTQDSVLARMDSILNRLEPNPPKTKFPTKKDLPPAQGAPAGTIRITNFPHRNTAQPGNVAIVWPATRSELPEQEQLLMQLFLSNLAGDATTTMYKTFVDTKTRKMETGATGVFAFFNDDPGLPITMGLVNVEPRHMTEPMLDSVRKTALADIARLAALPEGAPELVEFNNRMKSRVIQTRRDLAKFVNSPPGFGLRGTGSAWMEHLDDLEETGRFRRSVTAKPELAWIDSILAAPGNPWRGFIARWRLTSDVPYVAAAKPDADVLAKDVAERQARAAAETARLRALYSAASDQDAVKRYQAQYDSTTAALEAAAASDAAQRFIDAPPLTLDDELDWRQETLAGEVPLIASTFESMTSATTGLALRANEVAERDLVYLSLMPGLLTQVGVIENGTPVPYERMSERLRREILALNANFSTNPRTGRVELVVRGSGNDAEEAQRAIGWMRLALGSPDWRPENLPRIRDVVEQAATGLRNVTQGAEENWVNGVATAYRRQDHAQLLATSSFMTQAHNAHRLKWMLRDAGTGADREAISAFLTRLGTTGRSASRADLNALFAAMRPAPAPAQGASAATGGNGPTIPPQPGLPVKLAPVHAAFVALPQGAKALASQAAADLTALITDVPDATLAADFAYLVGQIRGDLLMPPAEALQRMDAVRRSLLDSGNARTWMVGSRATQATLIPQLSSLLGTLAPTSRPRSASLGGNMPATAATGIVTARLRDRAKGAKPMYVGLVQPNLQSGVFLHSVPLATYADTSRETVLRYLASKLYGGGGAHGIFMKTWGAGLAYSNGLGGSPASGLITYYAERTPELPQTLKFVINELKRAKPSEALAEYALAVAFRDTRAALSYEARAEGMATDLADGISPEQVKAFRRAMLATRAMPGLADSLFARMPAAYAPLLPGFEKGKATAPEGAVYLVIGSDRQMGLWEDYLKSEVSSDARLHRLYPRDFWLTKDSAVQ